MYYKQCSSQKSGQIKVSIVIKRRNTLFGMNRDCNSLLITTHRYATEAGFINNLEHSVVELCVLILSFTAVELCGNQTTATVT